MANYLHALQLKHVQEAGSHEVEHAKLGKQTITKMISHLISSRSTPQKGTRRTTCRT